MSETLGEIYLQSVDKRFRIYKDLGDKTLLQLKDGDFDFRPNAESNSAGIIIQHISGNMISRFTDLLTEDGEKPWRDRDAEFEESGYSRKQYLELWEQGWAVLFGALHSLTPGDLTKTVFIRNEPLPVVDAINRQLAHYPHHIGQLVYIGKILRNEGWKTLSIPKGLSVQFNREMTGNTKS